jgi:hypothetical protein
MEWRAAMLLNERLTWGGVLRLNGRLYCCHLSVGMALY